MTLKNRFMLVLFVMCLLPQLAIGKEEDKKQPTKLDLAIKKVRTIELKALQAATEMLAKELEIFNNDWHQNLAEEEEVSKFLEVISKYVEPFYKKLDERRVELEKYLEENKNIKENSTTKKNVPKKPLSNPEP